MERNELTRKRLAEHYRAYPRMEIADLFKYVFQSVKGCEHMVPSEAAAMEGVRREYAACEHGALPTAFPAVDPLDGGFSRVHLTCPEVGISPETLGKLFCRSARVSGGDDAALTQRLAVARDMILAGELPFLPSEFDSLQAQWQAAGYPAVRHSEAFRAAYRPAYRVIANGYARLLPFLGRIETLMRGGSGKHGGTVTVAIEGGSACGKTTLASLLAELYDCTVLHMDDFFLRPEQRTPARRAEVGGNVDRERFLEEVLRPLGEGRVPEYRRFNCGTQTLEPPVTVARKPLTVIEGVYSMHPELTGYYDLSLFLEISPDLQRERILKRNPSPLAERFFEEWIPLEAAYFVGMNVKARCELCLCEDTPR